MANPDLTHLKVIDRVKLLQADARARYGCVVVVNQSMRTPEQAQAFHVCHMFLYNLFWATGKRHIVPKFQADNAHTISWSHLSDPAVVWKPIRAEDLLRTAADEPVRRANGKWIPGLEPDRQKTILHMASYLRRHHVPKQAAPGVYPCAEPCGCPGHASKHLTGEACDLGGLNHLNQIIASAGDTPHNPKALDDYLASFGLWRPMAAPGMGQELWHVEAKPVSHHLQHHHSHHDHPRC